MIEFFSDPMIFSFSFIIISVLSFDFVLDGFFICIFFCDNLPLCWGKMSQQLGQVDTALYFSGCNIVDPY